MLHLLLALLLIGSPLMPRKPVTIDERFAAIERRHDEAMLAVGTQFDHVARALRDHAEDRIASDRSIAASRLEPGRLDALSGPWRGGSFSRAPDLGQPLLSRLRDDNLMQSAQQSTAVVLDGGNVLADPLFEAVAWGTAITPGVGDTVVGPFWSCKYVHNSGTAPSLRNIFKGWVRSDFLGRSNGGSSLEFDVRWAAGGADGNETYYLYPPHPGVWDIGYDAAAVASLPWVVASATVIPTVLDTDLTAVTVYMEIIDAMTGAVIGTSDSAEMVGLPPGQRVPLRVATDARVNPGGGAGWGWRFRVDIARTGAGAVTTSSLRIFEPSFSRSYTEMTRPFQPSIGHWYPPQLVLKTFVFPNLPAGATTEIAMSDAAMGVNRIVIPAYWAIAGLTVRLSANKTAGTLTVRGTVNGTYQTGDPSVAVGNATTDGDSGIVLPDQANFITANKTSAIGVEAIADAGFLPAATAEIVVDVFLWLYQA